MRNVGKLNSKAEIIVYLASFIDEVGKEIGKLESKARTARQYEENTIRQAFDNMMLDGNTIDELVRDMLVGKES